MNKLNFLEVNAAQITKEGISGNSLSKILSLLVNYSHRQYFIKGGKLETEEVKK